MPETWLYVACNKNGLVEKLDSLENVSSCATWLSVDLHVLNLMQIY